MKQFKFKKKYGQNFLIDNNILDKIIKNLNISIDDLVIEIGAGSGNLTKLLLEFNSKLIAYEIDLDTKKYLDEISTNNSKIIFEDILTRNIKDDIKDIQYNNLFIIGNLPYYITTPIIEKITNENINPKEMYFMVQKEVAERLSAQPKSKDYGYITVYLNYFYKIEKLFDVNRKSFNPVPNVDSSIIKLSTHNKYEVKDQRKFVNLIKSSFQFKRKTLLNNLKQYNIKKVEEILLKNNYSKLVRAEELPIEIFIEISNAI